MNYRINCSFEEVTGTAETGITGIRTGMQNLLWGQLLKLGCFLLSVSLFVFLNFSKKNGRDSACVKEIPVFNVLSPGSPLETSGNI